MPWVGLLHTILLAKNPIHYHSNGAFLSAVSNQKQQRSATTGNKQKKNIAGCVQMETADRHSVHKTKRLLG